MCLALLKVLGSYNYRLFRKQTTGGKQVMQPAHMRIQPCQRLLPEPARPLWDNPVTLLLSAVPSVLYLLCDVSKVVDVVEQHETII